MSCLYFCRRWICLPPSVSDKHEAPQAGAQVSGELGKRLKRSEFFSAEHQAKQTQKTSNMRAGVVLKFTFTSTIYREGERDADFLSLMKTYFSCCCSVNKCEPLRCKIAKWRHNPVGSLWRRPNENKLLFSLHCFTNDICCFFFYHLTVTLFTIN